jgi:hypothetical protein
MRIRNKKTYYLKAKITIIDAEGGKYPSFGDAVEIKANIYPADGQLQAEVYGEHLDYIMNMLYDGGVSKVITDGILHYISLDGKIDFCEGYGVCVNVSSDSKPDFKIKSIKQYSHLFMELEKL